MAEFMQSRVTLEDLAVDPRIFAFRAGLDHGRKRFVDGHLKRFPAHETPQRMRYVKIFQGQNGPRIRREPFDRIIGHGHRENTESIPFEQKIGIDHGR